MTVIQLNPTVDVNGTCAQPFSSSTGFNGTPALEHRTVSLASFANHQVRLRFYFDTRDALYNSFEGWYLDNIKITDPTKGTILSDNAESGNAIGWAIIDSHVAPDWHITTRRSTQFGGHAWWYGNEATGTYEASPDPFPGDQCSDAHNFGALISPLITLGASSTLEFDTLWQIESVDAHAFDLMRVQVEDASNLSATTTTVQNATVTFGTASVQLSASVSSPAGTPGAGVVFFTVKQSGTVVGRVSASVGTGGTATATFSLAGLSAGTYTIEATYTDTASFATSTGTGTLTIGKASTTVDAQNATAVFGQPTVTLTATLTGSIVSEGGVTFTVKRADGTAAGTASGNAANGTATAPFTLGALAPGTYSIEAAYSGSTNFDGSTDPTPATLTVTKANTTTQPSNANATLADSSVNLIATVQAQSPSTATVNEGTVTFTVKRFDGTVLGTATSGTVTGNLATATFAILSGTSPGNYPIEATYSGGPNFNGSTSAPGPLLSITKAATTTTVRSVTATFGDPSIDLVAGVTSPTAIPDGTVQFAILTSAGAQVGTASATLFPGGNLDQAQQTIDQTVGPLAIGGSSEQKLAQVVTPGQNGLLTRVHVPVACVSNAQLKLEIQGVTGGQPNGTVLGSRVYAGNGFPAFLAGAAELRPLLLSTPVSVTAGTPFAFVLSTEPINGPTCAINQGPAGNPYAGGNAFFDARPNAPGWAALGRDLPFQTYVHVAGATGGDAFAIASFPLTLNAGSYTIQATYAGTTSFFGSSGSAALTVDTKPTTTTVANVNAVFGQTITLTATVSGSPVNEGTVLFSIQSVPPPGSPPVAVGQASAAVVNGTATTTFALPSTAVPGAYSITGDYSGGQNHKPSLGTATLTVSKADTKTTPANATATFGDASVTLTADVTAVAPSTAVVNEGQVLFTVKQGTTTIGTPTSANVLNGKASVSYALPAGTSPGAYTIQADYTSPGSNFNPSSGTATFTVNKAPTTTTAANAIATFGDANVALLATVASAAGAPVGTVTFTAKKSDGTPVGTSVVADVGAAGAATATFPLAGVNADTYSVQAAFGQSTNFADSSASATLTVNKANTATDAADVAAVVGQTVTLSATVTSGGGGGSGGGSLSWASRASMPTARHGVGVAAAGNGKIYVVGGATGNWAGQLLSTVEEYDPATNTWATKASMPTPRAGLALVTHPNGKIYAIGGFTGATVTTVEEYDPATNTWATKASMATGRYGLGAAVGPNGKIYAIGGFTGGIGFRADVEEYDPTANTWTTKASMPTARFGVAVTAASNGKIYAIGGQVSFPPAGYTSAVEEYDPSTNTWATKASMPTARAELAAVGASNGKVYAVGGYNGALAQDGGYLGPPLATVEEYDPAANVWTSRASMPTARVGLGLARASNGKLYAVGGFNATVVATNEEATIAGAGPLTVSEGTVTFTIKQSGLPVGTATSGTVAAGKATASFSLGSLAVGTYSIEAAYSGGTNFNASTDPTPATLSIQRGAAANATCNGTSLPNAQWTLYSGADPVLTGTTDSTGLFMATGLAAGDYSVVFTSGTTTCGTSFTVQANGGATVTPPPPLADFANHTWRNAKELTLTPTASTFCANLITVATAEHLYKAKQSLWFRFFNPGKGSRVFIKVSDAKFNVDLYVYRDPTLAFSGLTGTRSLARLTAGFADGDFADGDFADGDYADGDFADGDFADGDFADGDFADGDFADGDFADGDFADGDFADGDFADGDFAPDQLSPNEPVFGDENTSALRRSRIGISVRDGTAPERFARISWGDPGFVYFRIKGRGTAFSTSDAVQIEVKVCPGSCGSVNPIDASVAAGGEVVLNPTQPGPYKTIIVTDLARMSGKPTLTAALADPSVSALLQAMKDFAALPEVAATIVDGGPETRGAAGKAQSDANLLCSYARNVWATEVKRVIDARRSGNPLQYVVLVGDGGVIPFFHSLDRGGLARESRWAPGPPVFGDTASQTGLRQNQVLSQDRYGAAFDIPIGDHDFPIVDLAVGRLIGESIEDTRQQFLAYPAATHGVVQLDSRPLVAAYGKMFDGADATVAQLQRSLGTAGVDTLIDRGGPLEPGAWDVTQFRSNFLQRRSVAFVGAHGRDGSALMADYKTRFLASEIASSSVDMTNAVHVWLACHVGYPTSRAEAIAGFAQLPSFAEAYAKKRAVLIARMGYSYFDTDIVEYGERWNVEFSKQLVSGDLTLGRAFVAAKIAYLKGTLQLTGLHEKELLEITYFGLPHLKVALPLVPASGTGSIVAATTSLNTMGLSTADINVGFNPAQQGPVPLRDPLGNVLTPGGTFFTGGDGVVADRTLPILPLDQRNVSVANTTLRGAALLEGDYGEIPGQRPLTSAPAFELTAVHATFYSDVLWPVQPWRVNYYDFLASDTGQTFINFTPVQYVSVPAGSQTGTDRRLTRMKVRLFYSNDTSAAALVSPPAVSVLSANVKGKDAAGNTLVEFRVRITTDPSAPIEQAWITYFTVGGTTIRSTNLLSRDANDPTIWTVTQAFAAAPSDIRYGAWAVNAKGLVGRDLNGGRYYNPGAAAPTIDNPKQRTAVTIESPVVSPTGIAPSGFYRSGTSITALLTSNGAPVANQRLSFGIGGETLAVATDTTGHATAKLKLLANPGDYTLHVSYNETPGVLLLGSAADEPFTIKKMQTTLTLAPASATAQYSDDAGVVATLSETATGHKMAQQFVIFQVKGTDVTGAARTYVTNQLTRFDGTASLFTIPLPAGSYTVQAFFAGQLPTASGGTVTIDSPTYEPSQSSTIPLTVTPEDATVTYTGDTVIPLGTSIALTAKVAEVPDATPGDITNANIKFTVFREDGTTAATQTVRAAADGTVTGQPVANLPAGLYKVVAEADKLFYQGSASDFVAIFDPSTFVTGGGWFITPTTATGVLPGKKASFGFNLKYLNGTEIPTGNFEFQHLTMNYNFKATSFSWLIIDSTRTRAELLGNGTVNGVGSNCFRAIVTDGNPDTFFIQIWENTTCADQLPSSTPTKSAPATALGGGNIVIH